VAGSSLVGLTSEATRLLGMPPVGAQTGQVVAAAVTEVAAVLPRVGLRTSIDVNSLLCDSHPRACWLCHAPCHRRSDPPANNKWNKPVLDQGLLNKRFVSLCNCRAPSPFDRSPAPPLSAQNPGSLTAP